MPHVHPQPHSWRGLRTVCAVLVCMVTPLPSAEAQIAAADQPGAVMWQGIVADMARGVIYVMRPGGGIAALDLATGATRWSSAQADVPLAIAGTTLIAQDASTAAAGTFAVVSLDTRAQGRRVARATVALGDAVPAGVGESLEGTFSVFAQRAGGDVVLHWRFVPATPKGAMEVADTIAVFRGPFGGALQLTPRTARLRAVGVARTPALLRAAGARDVALPPPPRPRWILRGDQRLTSSAALPPPPPGAPGGQAAPATQYESADGRHVLVSDRVADDRTWDKYRWTILERATGQRLGDFQLHTSFSPFVVHNGVVVFETTPWLRAGQAPEPAKVRGVSLTTGREVWSAPVREVVYRGVLPP